MDERQDSTVSKSSTPTKTLIDAVIRHLDWQHHRLELRARQRLARQLKRRGQDHGQQ
jgi:hypothetical protein